jgi:carbon monoxide dehydrogenase subunit G
MLIENRITVPAPPERVWAFMMDIPSVSRCVPGVDGVARIDDQTYSGVMSVRVGPIAIKLDGRVILAERDESAARARMDLQAADRRVNGAVNARMSMQLSPADDGAGTDVAIRTDANVMGKIGEFGQAVIRKKADQIVQEFARNLSAAVAAGGSWSAEIHAEGSKGVPLDPRLGRGGRVRRNPRGRIQGGSPLTPASEGRPSPPKIANHSAPRC